MNASPCVAAYAPTIDTFVPGCGEEERRLRAGVLYYRDKATAAGRSARVGPGMVLDVIASLATVHAFRPMPIEQLRELRDALVRMYQAASALEMRGPGSPLPDETER